MKLVEEYILRQPEKYRSILLHIINLVQQELSNTSLLFKWGIPYIYYKNKPFCYLAPNHKKKFVDVGFAKGFQLIKHQDKLIGKNRNTVKSLRYFKLEEIDNEVLKDLIEEAKNLYK